MLDEKKWRKLVLKAIDDGREDIFDTLLDIADKNSLGSLWAEGAQKMRTIPMARKLKARGVDFHDFLSDGNSIYAYLLNKELEYSENRKEVMSNALTLVSFFKHELKIIPKPETVLKDLSKIAVRGDWCIDFLAALYEFPHDDSQKIENKHWYTDALGELRHAGGFHSYFLKTYQFLHNKKIPLATIENDDGQNLLHVLYQDGYEEAIHTHYRATFWSNTFTPMVAFLVQVGVDPNKKDKHDKVPYDYAEYSQCKGWFDSGLKSTVNKEIVFPLEIMPVPPHELSAVVSFSNPALQSNNAASGSAAKPLLL